MNRSILREGRNMLRPYIGYEMKMQMLKFLVFPAVDDETVRGEMIFIHDGLRRGDEVRQERVGRIQVREGADGFLRNDNDMERVGRFRMEKSQQGVGLTQAFDGDGKRDVVQHPDKDPVEKCAAQEAVNFIHQK